MHEGGREGREIERGGERDRGGGGGREKQTEIEREREKQSVCVLCIYELRKFDNAKHKH